MTNPALFSQALMYHCHRYSKQGWAGEPEIDPTQCYEEREAIEGWELTPAQCLENAHTAVLREKSVVAGKSTSATGSLTTWVQSDDRFQHGNYPQFQRVLRAFANTKVRMLCL